MGVMVWKVFLWSLGQNELQARWTSLHRWRAQAQQILLGLTVKRVKKKYIYIYIYIYGQNIPYYIYIYTHTESKFGKNWM